MRILILGGTRFVGRHLTEAALAAGHQVTLFHRGRTNPDLFPEAEHLHGDRGKDLAVLAGRRWNVAIDVNGYLPREVRASAELLAGAVERYVFISTISVYADFKTPGIREDAPLEAPEPGDAEAGEVPPGGYGRLKVLCERFVEAAFPEPGADRPPLSRRRALGPHRPLHLLGRTGVPGRRGPRPRPSGPPGRADRRPRSRRLGGENGGPPRGGDLQRGGSRRDPHHAGDAGRLPRLDRRQRGLHLGG